MLRLPTPFALDLHVEPAGLGERIIAYLLDGLIVGAYMLGMYGLVFGVVLSGLGGPVAGIVLGTLMVVAAIPVVFYHLLCEIFLDGQSIGKRARGIRVISVDGAAPSLGSYVLRWLFRIVDMPLYGAVAIVSIASTERSQRLGDLAAGTTVVKRAPAPDLDRTPYAPLPPGYAVRYPGAERLTDRDVETVKAVLARFRAEGRTPDTARLGARARKAVQRAAHIGPVQEHDEPFLQRVVMDYNALLDRYDVPIESQSARRTTREPARSTSADAGP